MFMEGKEDADPYVESRAGPRTTTPELEASQQARIQEAIRIKLENERAEIMQREKALADAKAEPVEVPFEDRKRGLVAVKQPEGVDEAARPALRKKIERRQPSPTPRRQPPASSSQGETKQNSALTYLKHARTKMQEGNFGSAQRMLDIAIGKDSKCGECYEARAECKQKTGDPAGAADDLNRAKQLGNGGSARVGNGSSAPAAQ